MCIISASDSSDIPFTGNNLDQRELRSEMTGAFLLQLLKGSTRLETIEKRVTDLVLPVLADLGINLWGIKVIRNPKRTTLQIFIEREGGVTIDDCERVSQELGSVFDVADFFRYPYILEVSSPGMDRYLFNLDQVGMYIGKNVTAEVSLPVDNHRRFRGVLEKLDGDILSIVQDNKTYEIAYPNISRIQLVPEFK